MTQDRNLALEDRTRLTEIQDLLFERIIERKEAIERGEDDVRKYLGTKSKRSNGKRRTSENG